MATNSNNNINSSSAGNDPFDLSWIFQSNDSNVDLNHVGSLTGSGLNLNDLSLGHRQLGMVTSMTTEVRRTYVSPRPCHQSTSFSLHDETLTHEVVKTTHFFAPPSMMDHFMFSSNSGVGNQGTLPTNISVRIQEQGQAAAVSNFQPNSSVRFQGGTLPSSSIQPTSGNQPAEQSQPVARNQRSRSAHEVIDVDAYDSDVRDNSSRASENQPHWPNMQVRNDVFFENLSMNPVNHGSGNINVPINGGIHENSANANDPQLDNTGQDGGRGRGRGRGHGRGRSTDQDGMADSFPPQNRGVGSGRGRDRGRGRGQGRKNDGRIHCLPRGDNGGYYCPFPECQNLVFQTTQGFVAHASSIHHSAETSEERQRRNEARFGKRKLSLSLTKCGISVMPDKLNFKPVKLGENQSNSKWENDGERTIAVGSQDIKPRILLGININ
ncbi:hypothetical protein CCACVL1_19652 [Corchorus capsularis]|uniref:C2H2-type domain-containing protein n=1 Tax=Corchorus capsularis TaxID=210143 RepID=A0A1R3HFF4_COCAP|nr:hypothetical protein CCACVL1_19652 [Corchorus capsularis]